jgi:hypothetical protein
VARADANVYVGNGTHIARANNDGTAVDPNWMNSNGFACGVAVTPTHIYWAWLGGIGRARIDGDSPDPNFVTAPGGSTYCGVTVSGQYLYWTDETQNRIGRVELSGANPAPTFASTSAAPCAVAADSTRLYWSPLASGPVGAVLQSNGAATPAPPTGASACSVATNSNGIFYADRNAAGATSIGFVLYGGTAITLGLTATKPCGITATSSQVLWVNEQSGTVGTAVLNPNGTAGPANQSLITGLSDPCGVALDGLPVPQAPVLAATDPASPGASLQPKIRGTLGTGNATQVKVFANAACSGTPTAIGAPSDFTGPGIAVAVDAGSTTAFTAAATNAGGDSTCSNSISYTQQDTVIQPPGDTTPPDTIKGKGPARKSTKTKATIEFSSDDPGATFECALDGKPAAPCASPVKLKHLKPGKHKFTVTAIDSAGNNDPSPAVYGFKVKRKRR